MASVFLTEQLKPVQIGGTFVILAAIVVLNCSFRITLFQSRALKVGLKKQMGKSVCEEKITIIR